MVVPSGFSSAEKGVRPIAPLPRASLPGPADGLEIPREPLQQVGSHVRAKKPPRKRRSLFVSWRNPPARLEMVYNFKNDQGEWTFAFKINDQLWINWQRQDYSAASYRARFCDKSGLFALEEEREAEEIAGRFLSQEDGRLLKITLDGLSEEVQKKLGEWSKKAVFRRLEADGYVWIIQEDKIFVAQSSSGLEAVYYPVRRSADRLMFKEKTAAVILETFPDEVRKALLKLPEGESFFSGLFEKQDAPVSAERSACGVSAPVLGPQAGIFSETKPASFFERFFRRPWKRILGWPKAFFSRIFRALMGLLRKVRGS
ncbi:MAG: hypothetical protein WC371_00220 [Parachlamydiales bacterium]|jgi:hypothetical protein